MNRAVFLDRDGVINQRAADGGYILGWGQFEFVPSAAEAIRMLNQAGWLVIVVTNQRAVAKQLLIESELCQIHQKMAEKLSNEGARIDAVYYCPHDVEDDCQCRKPKPGMILQAAREHGIELSASWTVGDDLRDIEAGQAAGCRTIWIRSASAAGRTEPAPKPTVESLAAAVAIILAARPLGTGAEPTAGAEPRVTRDRQVL